MNGDLSLSSVGIIRKPLFPFVNVFPEAIFLKRLGNSLSVA